MQFERVMISHLCAPVGLTAHQPSFGNGTDDVHSIPYLLIHTPIPTFPHNTHATFSSLLRQHITQPHTVHTTAFPTQHMLTFSKSAATFSSSSLNARLSGSSSSAAPPPLPLCAPACPRGGGGGGNSCSYGSNPRPCSYAAPPVCSGSSVCMMVGECLIRWLERKGPFHT